MPVLIDGSTYYEGVNLSPGDFYRFMLEGHAVSTSQPSPGDVMEMWDRILERHEELVYIPMSSGLSASCQTALCLAAEYHGRVWVVDHLSVSVPQRYAVLDALKLAAGGRGGGEIKAALEKTAPDTVIYIGVDTLEFLKKGGRITPAVAKMGSLLRVKPLLQIRGALLESHAQVHGTKGCKRRVMEELRTWVEKYEASGDPFSIGAADTFLSSGEEEEWISMARAAFPGRDIRYDPLACSIGCHVGPGAFGMAVSKRVPAGEKALSAGG
ncbi:MAG: DegV family protein [Dysosmobacter sp.]|nr:DegV family protein [Dysosmobacter sp.]MDY3282507.1 DegV family protein [Dysosmobacter sp.]